MLRKLCQTRNGKCSWVYNIKVDAALCQPDRAIKHQRTQTDERKVGKENWAEAPESIPSFKSSALRFKTTQRKGLKRFPLAEINILPALICPVGAMELYVGKQRECIS